MIHFAQESGFVILRTYPSRQLLDVAATVKDIETTQHVAFNGYYHPTETRTFFAPSRDPQLDSNVPVLCFTGLDNYRIPHRSHLTQGVTSGTKPIPNIGTAPDHNSYWGSDFRAAYAPGVSLFGAGQVVGLLEFDGFSTTAIEAYEDKAPVDHSIIPSPWRVFVRPIPVDDFDGLPGANEEEVELDIEMAISMAPQLSQVTVYEAHDTSHFVSILHEMAYPTQGEPLPMQLSSSWTLPDDPNADNVYLRFRYNGQSFFQSSGDHGAYYTGIDEWADSPYVTIVGGTALSTSSPGGSWSNETVWNSGRNIQGVLVGSGGGSSDICNGNQPYPIPFWQKNMNNIQANGGSTTMRNGPDVAMVATNIWVV